MPTYDEQTRARLLALINERKLRMPSRNVSEPRSASSGNGHLSRAAIEAMDPTSRLRQILEAALLGEDQGRPVANRFKNITAEVEWQGSKLILPATPAHMSFAEGRDWLTRVEQQGQQPIAINEVVEAAPFDGAIAFMRALKQIYGWASAVPPRSFFEAPPTMLSVNISPTAKTQIIWGRFSIPGLEDGTLVTGATMDRGRHVFVIQGQVKQKYLEAVAEIADLTRKFVAEESIYRGKPIRLPTDSDGDLDLTEAPAFLDVSQAKREELIFSRELTEQVQTNLFTPIEHSQACRDNQVPLKRGILMEGEFGTGKTLCAYVTAQIAQENDWTFILIDRVTALSAALSFAVQYQPCVIFCEDIDRETTGERTPELDEILNTIDGIGSKGKEIITVLTSNEAEKINRAMMRPGRLDAVLSIVAPDAEAAQKLMRLYGRGLIADDETLLGAGAELAGQIPAVIRECVERAKLYSVSRNPTKGITLVDEDLVHSARGMKRHLELLNGKTDEAKSAEHKLGAALGDVIGDAINDKFEEVTADIDGTYSVVRDIRDIIRKRW